MGEKTVGQKPLGAFPVYPRLSNVLVALLRIGPVIALGVADAIGLEALAGVCISTEIPGCSSDWL